MQQKLIWNVIIKIDISDCNSNNSTVLVATFFSVKLSVGFLVDGGYNSLYKFPSPFGSFLENGEPRIIIFR